MLGREVGVAQRHLIVRMAQEFTHRVEIDACHDQAGCEGVSEIMPAKLLNSSCLQDSRPGLAHVVEPVAVLSRKDEPVGFGWLIPPALQNGQGFRIERDSRNLRDARKIA